MSLSYTKLWLVSDGLLWDMLYREATHGKNLRHARKMLLLCPC